MVLETGRRLAQRGYKIHCVCIQADEAIVGDYSEIRFHTLGGPLSSSILFWIGFLRSCKQVLMKVDFLVREQPEANWVLFPQVFPANWWGGYVLSARPKLKCLWFCQEPSAFIHSTDWINALKWPKNWIAHALRPFLCRIDIRICRRFRSVCVNSEYTKNYAQTVYRYGPDVCKVIYPGVDLLKFGPPHQHVRKPWIACVAKLTRFKNIDRVIDAVSDLVQTGFTDFHLHIVGTGDVESDLRSQVRRLRLASHVSFHGHLDDHQLVDLLRNCKGLCLASTNEPFGLVAIESLACGTPVIAVRSGGPAEIVGKTGAGLLIEQPDATLIANAIRELLEPSHDFESRHQMARTRAEDFGWERSIASLENEFAKCIL